MIKSPYELTPEYLGLKISYLRNYLRNTPRVYLWRRGNSTTLHIKNGKEYFNGQKEYEELLNLYNKRNEATEGLIKLEQTWSEIFNCPFDKSGFKYINHSTKGPVERLFGKWDDLEVAQNTYADKRHVMYNGVDYDSKSEAQIARIYDEFGIPVKHNALINLGHNIKIDFALYLPEKQKMLLHEHFGMIGNSNYKDDLEWKFRKYINSGLVPGRDILMTFESETRYGDDDYYRSCIAQFINANL